jgi:cytochrome c biogenesis protein
LWCSIFICTLKRLKFKPQTFPTTITHLGLLIILAGACVTGILGEKGFMIIYEKHNQDTYIDAHNKFKTLDFKIYLDDFSIDYYDDAKKEARPGVSAGAGFIKDFRSKVVIRKQDKEILKETIEVNRPLRYKGYSFYQASYDRDNFKWTGLDVVKDPGVPFVWCGFILLNLGVILRFYFLPAAPPLPGQAGAA